MISKQLRCCILVFILLIAVEVGYNKIVDMKNKGQVVVHMDSESGVAIAEHESFTPTPIPLEESERVNGKININTASKELLEELSGIGPALADRIISYRQKEKFVIIEDIMKVSGIGKKKFEAIKDYIFVD